MHDIYTVTCNTEILESGSGDTNHINDDQTERRADTEMKQTFKYYPSILYSICTLYYMYILNPTQNQIAE